MLFENISMADESIRLLKYEPLKTYSLALLLTALLVVGTVIRLFILNFIIFHSPKDRSINNLVIYEQTAMMVSNIGYTSLALVSIFMATPLQEMFGDISCIILWTLYFVHNTVGASSGFGMAVFRTMFVCLPIVTHVKIGAYRLMRIIILAQVIFLCTVCYCYWQGLMLINNVVAFQFCHGHSANMEQELWIHQGGTEEQRKLGRFYQFISFLLGAILIALEVSLYAYLFRHLVKYDKAAAKKGIISADTVKNRKQVNVTSLTGQAISFLIETIGVSFVMITLSSPQFFGVERSIFVIINPLVSTSLAATVFFTSPELKRHYM